MITEAAYNIGGALMLAPIVLSFIIAFISEFSD